MLDCDVDCFLFAQAWHDFLNQKILFQVQYVYGCILLFSADFKFHLILHCWLINHYTGIFQTLLYMNYTAYALQHASLHPTSHRKGHIFLKHLEISRKFKTFSFIPLQPYIHTAPLRNIGTGTICMYYSSQPFPLHLRDSMRRYYCPSAP